MITAGQLKTPDDTNDKAPQINIANEYPPNYAEICRHFDIKANKNVVFTYGDTIYNPGGKPILPDLMAHEETHVHQQAKLGPEAWWEKYLADPEFRLSMELEAYRMQFAIIRTHYDRGTRRMLLRKIAKDLAGPIYGNILNTKQALEMITEANS